MKAIYKEAESLLERFYDPKINKLVLADEIAAYLTEVLQHLKADRTFTVQGLKKFARQLEYEILQYARLKRGWSESDMPLRIKLDLFTAEDGQHVHCDFSGGAIAYEVAQSYMKLVDFSKPQPLPWLKVQLREEEEELADDLNPGFRYGGG